MSSRLTGSARLKVMHVTLRPCGDVNVVSDVHNDPNIDISVGVGIR